MNDGTMLSRSGRTHEDGKMTARIDVPLPDAVHDQIVLRASDASKPKAEFARDLLVDALTQPMLIALSGEAREQLTAMAKLVGSEPNDLALQLLCDALKRSFGMTQSFARNQLLGQSEHGPRIIG